MRTFPNGGFTGITPSTTSPQSVAPNTHRPLAQDAFMNALRILHDLPLPRGARNHAEYLMRADDATVDRVWGEIQRRQPERFRA